MKRSIWHQNYVTLRKQLKTLRVENNFTQVELSKKLDKHQSYVSKYENGDRNIDIIELIQICDAINVDLVNFIKLLYQDITKHK